VNGERRQDGRTSEMRWNVGELISFVDLRVAFEPGDVVFTGTPAGVGHGDGRYLKPGDLIEATIERIGTQRNVIERRSS
jgi:2-keto-4-pentenoate hydratase/2-oxohepta-3-ene-1,7-dioic acid hydratase in catechol pathway